MDARVLATNEASFDWRYEEGADDPKKGVLGLRGMRGFDPEIGVATVEADQRDVSDPDDG